MQAEEQRRRRTPVQRETPDDGKLDVKQVADNVFRARPSEGPDIDGPDLTKELNCSSSVASFAALAGTFTNWNLIAKIMDVKPDYFDPAAWAQLQSSVERLGGLGPRQASLAWIREARLLVRDEFLLDGRMLVICLALLSEPSARTLDRFGILEKLLTDATGGGMEQFSFAAKLTPSGRQQFVLLQFEHDATRTVSDAASVVDLLFRKPFAEALALRIRSMRASDKLRPLMIHLDGEWGSGKTTLLGFVSEALCERPPTEKDPRWIVATYNAWQHQDLDSPWWTIANSVLLQLGQKAMSHWPTFLAGMRLTLRHWYFRLLGGRVGTILAAMAALAIALALLHYFPPTNSGDLDNLLKVGATGFAIVVAGWNLLAGRDTTSQAYLNSRPDPMMALERHVRESVCQLGIPVAVLVDDIDRCLAGNVVKLLEGIQVMFGKVPVVFLFAGDRNWINTSFRDVYKDFETISAAPGRSLGHRFLEKTFQLSVWVPKMTAAAKLQYWRAQLGLSDNRLPDARLKPDLSALGSEEEILAEASRIEAGLDEDAKLAFRQAAVRRLAQPDIEGRLTHSLEPFYPLVESNPRSMKRLVMMYGMIRTIDVLAGKQTPREVLARWAVLLSRWPDLGNWLQADPHRLAPEASAHCPEFDALLSTEDVRSVLRGGGIAGPVLDEDSLSSLLAI